jgi:hypothetical protein
VVWVLVSRVIPTAERDMEALQCGDVRIKKAAWRTDFKKMWKDVDVRDVDPANLRLYGTNPTSWVCGCDAFLLCRFVLCKHLLYCLEPIPNRSRCDFFDYIKRQRQRPFWVHEKLVVRPEFRTQSPTLGIQEPQRLAAVQDQNVDDSQGDGSDSSDCEDFRLADASDPEDDQPELDAAKYIATTRAFVEIMEAQAALGNYQFVLRCASTLVQNHVLVEEVRRLRNMKTMPTTWADFKHPASMYWEAG